MFTFMVIKTLMRIFTIESSLNAFLSLQGVETLKNDTILKVIRKIT